MTIQGTGGGKIISSPSGISCSSATCTADFTAGTIVTLTATPDSSSTLTNWNGECTASGTVCSAMMSVDRAVGAVFDRVVAITAQVSVSEAVFQAVPGVNIRVGSQVTFVATGIVCHDAPGCSTRDTPNGSGLGTGGPSAKLPGAPLHSLICGIGGQSPADLFFVGTNLTITSTRAGSLFCGMNEGQGDQSQYQDNGGWWTLSVQVGG